MPDSIRMIPTSRPDGAVILECPCGYRGFADAHGKAVCPRCNRGAVVASVEPVATKAAAPKRARK